MEANVEQIQSDTNDVSTLINSKQMSNLDVNGRNEAGLILLTPGVTTGNADFVLPSRMGSFCIGGAATTSNVWLINGAEFMDRGSNGPGMVPSVDALSEFKVLTSNYGADYGFGAGGTIAMEIKTGTRNFHGGLWEYVRNDDLDSNNYFSNLSHTAPPELRFNTYGGNLGGPLFIPHHYNKERQKTFFFINEEWRKYVTGSVINDTLPTAAERTGNFSDRPNAIYVPSTVGDPAKLAQFGSLGLVPGSPFPGNIIPSSLIDPNVKSYLATGTLPLPTSGSQYVAAPNTVASIWETITRVDHAVNDKTKIDISQSYFRFLATVPANSLDGSLPTIKFLERNTFWTGVGRMTSIIRPNFINTVTFDLSTNGLTYNDAGAWQLPSGWSVDKLFSDNDAFHRLPNVSIGTPYSGASTGTNYLPGVDGGLNFQERDDLFWTKGTHNFKFGGSFNHYTKNQTDSENPEGSSGFSGSYTAEYASSGATLVAGNSFADMLLGMQGSYSESAIEPESRYIAKFWDAYAVDDWHLSNRLTFNLGLRWDGLPHSIERNNQTGNFVPADYNPANAAVFNSAGNISATSPGIGTVSSAPGSTIALSSTTFYLNGLVLATRTGVPRGVVANHWTDFGPRVGFAYNVFGTGKTVLRAGAGIFSQNISEETDIYNNSSNPPFNYTPSLSSVYFSNPNVSTINGQTLPAFPILASSIYSMLTAYPHPKSAQWSLGIQQQLNRISILSVAYVGSSAWHQIAMTPIDTVPLSDPNRAAIASGKYNANFDRIYSGYSGITQQENTGNLHYDSLQATFRIEDHRGHNVVRVQEVF